MTHLLRNRILAIDLANKPGSSASLSYSIGTSACVAVVERSLSN